MKPVGFTLNKLQTQGSKLMENVFTDFILSIHQFANTKHVMSAAFISNGGKTGLSSLT